MSVAASIRPMLAKLVTDIPEGMLYEPKFDGFRCIVFRDGDSVELGSRNERPMTRYFPEVVEAAKRELPEQCIVDGEIVIIQQNELDFDSLLLRIHPADSRVRLLASQIPASFIAFDLLSLDGESLMDRPFEERRARLEKALAAAGPPVYITPITDSTDTARDWFRVFEGAGLDGVIAKPREVAYLPDQRAMFKIKHERTADCVVAGFRWHKSGPVVGSLLLGLHDDKGRLQSVGVSASFNAARRKELLDEIAPYRMESGEEHPWGDWHGLDRIPGEQSRWNRAKDLSWEPLRPELVAEVAYDHMQGTRFRHVTYFKRWRPDKDPADCTFDQLDRPVAFDLTEVLTSPTQLSP